MFLKHPTPIPKYSVTLFSFKTRLQRSTPGVACTDWGLWIWRGGQCIYKTAACGVTIFYQDAYMCAHRLMIACMHLCVCVYACVRVFMCEYMQVWQYVCLLRMPKRKSPVDDNLHIAKQNKLAVLALKKLQYPQQTCAC